LNVRLLNALALNDGTNGRRSSAIQGYEDRSTNIHTHGLIVSPKNARDDPRNNGDNIFVSLGRGQSLDYSMQVPFLPVSWRARRCWYVRTDLRGCLRGPKELIRKRIGCGFLYLVAIMAASLAVLRGDRPGPPGFFSKGGMRVTRPNGSRCRRAAREST
jgi:hypothetical protein